MESREKRLVSFGKLVFFWRGEIWVTGELFFD